MLRRYPGSLRWRQALPPLFVLGLIVLLIASFWLPAAGCAVLAVLAVYGTALLLSGVDTAIQLRSVPLAFGVPLAVAVMHISWGGAFLFNFVRQLFVPQKPDKEKLT
jgi:hypothetical protein